MAVFSFLLLFCLCLLLIVVVTVNSENVTDMSLPAFHYTPLPHEWMNDPNGPLYDPKFNKYHLFTQYKTPRVWSHAVSDDLLNWINCFVLSFFVFFVFLFLICKKYKQTSKHTNKNIQTHTKVPIAIENDEKYNMGGVYTGSATVLPNGDINILYAVASNLYICLAYPTNRSDPYLTQWTNYRLKFFLFCCVCVHACVV